MDFTGVYYLLISTLIFMTTKVNNMTTTINITSKNFIFKTKHITHYCVYLYVNISLFPKG